MAVDESRRCFFLSREVQISVKKRAIYKTVSTILSLKLNRCKMFLVFFYFQVLKLRVLGLSSSQQVVNLVKMDPCALSQDTPL